MDKTQRYVIAIFGIVAAAFVASLAIDSYERHLVRLSNMETQERLTDANLAAQERMVRIQEEASIGRRLES